MPSRTPDLTTKEMNQFRETIKTLEEAGGWTRTELAAALGYAGISSLSTVMNDESKQTTRPRYEAALQIMEKNMKPGTIVIDRNEKPAKGEKAGRTRRTDMIPDNEVRVFEQLFDLLKGRGISIEDIATGIGYNSPASIYQAVRRRRIPTEIFQNMKDFAKSDTVARKSQDAGQMPPVLPDRERPPSEQRIVSTNSYSPAPAHSAPPRGLNSTLDYLQASIKQIRTGTQTLEKGLQEKRFKKLLEPGIDRAVKGIDQWVRDLEELISEQSPLEQSPEASERDPNP